MKTYLDYLIVGSSSGVLIFVVVIGLVIVGSMTAGDLNDEQTAYCKAVHEQTYPDYKKTFEKSCKEWLTEQNKSVN